MGYNYSYTQTDVINTRGFKLPEKYYKNGGVIGLIKKQESMKLVPKNAVPKAQLGTWDWKNLMSNLESQLSWQDKQKSTATNKLKTASERLEKD